MRYHFANTRWKDIRPCKAVPSVCDVALKAMHILFASERMRIEGNNFNLLIGLVELILWEEQPSFYLLQSTLGLSLFFYNLRKQILNI